MNPARRSRARRSRSEPRNGTASAGQTTFEKFSTDHEGKVEFGKQHAWAMQVMLPDGGTSYTWSLCVSKPGFEAIPMVSMKFNEVIKVAMYPSAVRRDANGGSTNPDPT